MILTCTEQPGQEPITLSDVERQIRVTDLSSEATEIELFIQAVRERAESITRRALVTQSWDLTLDAFPSNNWNFASQGGSFGNRIILPKPPLQTVNSIIYIDSNGDEQTLDPSLYKVVSKAEPGYVQPAYGTTWPTVLNDSAVVTINFNCGYGPIDPDTSLNVPAAIKQWMLLNIANLYESREAIGIAYRETKYDLTESLVDNLIENYRIARL